DDYCSYLDNLYVHFPEEIKAAERVGVLGFSQGVATAMRWIASSSHSFDYLINWAGAFPPDLDFEKAVERLRQMPLWMLAGTDDEYISDERFGEHLRFVKQKGFHPQTLRFE